MNFLKVVFKEINFCTNQTKMDFYFQPAKRAAFTVANQVRTRADFQPVRDALTDGVSKALQSAIPTSQNAEHVTGNSA